VNRAGDRFQADVDESGAGEEATDRISVAETVAHVDDRAEMPFGHALQVAYQVVLFEGPPGAQREAATRHEYATHFADRRGPIFEELQTLMAADCIEYFVARDRQSGRLSLTPLDRWLDGPSDGEHRGIHIDADNTGLVTGAGPCEPCDDAGAAGHVQKAISGREGRPQK
jgi:hypothetical protein